MIFGDGISQAYKARSEKDEIARRLQSLSDAELRPIVDNSRFSGAKKLLGYFDRTTVRERLVAEGILDLREAGWSPSAIGNFYERRYA